MALLRFAGYLFGLAAPMLICAPGHAARLDYRFDIGIEHNDNVNLSNTDPVSENILRPALGFAFSEEGSVVQARVDGILEYRDYLRGTYGNELRSQLGGGVNWVMLPGRLDFVFEDYLGVEPVDALIANAPSNLQQTNVFATGPTLNFRFGAAARGQAELRYIDSYAQKTDDFDSQRASGTLRIIRDLGPTSLLSGNAQVEHIEFDHPGIVPDFDRYSAYARYARTLRLLDLGVDLGYTWLDGAAPIGSRSQPLLRANAGWRPSQRSTFTLTAARQYSDAASGMLETIETPGEMRPDRHIPASIMTGNAVVSSAPYLESRIQLDYTFHGALGTLSLSPYYSKLVYLTQATSALAEDTDQNLRGGSVTASLALRHRLTFGVTASAENASYSGLARTDRSRDYGVFLYQRMTRHWSWRVDLSRYIRNSTAAGQDADQNIIYVGLSYTR